MESRQSDTHGKPVLQNGSEGLPSLLALCFLLSLSLSLSLATGSEDAVVSERREWCEGCQREDQQSSAALISLARRQTVDTAGERRFPRLLHVDARREGKKVSSRDPQVFHQTLPDRQTATTKRRRKCNLPVPRHSSCVPSLLSPAAGRLMRSPVHQILSNASIVFTHR